MVSDQAARAQTAPELSELVRRALEWAAADCDPHTAQLAVAMAKRGDAEELADHFLHQLEFGTAGLRAKVGPGPARMNAATVRKAALAVAQHLHTATPAPVVVVAFDGRATSRALAQECAGVLSAAGVMVRYFSEPIPTPLAAFAVLQVRADAGIVITASHNPAPDNGLKLYGRDGIQIVPPTDVTIAQLMNAAGAAQAIPFHARVFDGAQLNVVPVERGVYEAYLAIVTGLASVGAKDLKIAYTPLHGVGGAALLEVFSRAGYSDVRCVTEQLQVDATFPTVPFPNPEEPGVMDRVLTLAVQSKAELAIANDPDADRLAVAIPAGDGLFSSLSGNQVGLLLADHLLSGYRGAEPPLVVQSIVSSPMLALIAKRYGARCERTLTGFKWIMRAALGLQPQFRLVLGYEEALGYALCDAVRDKDGISAALVFAEMAGRAKALGLEIRDLLFSLYAEHGLWTSTPLSIVRPGTSGARQIHAAMQRVRTTPPHELAGLLVKDVVDYQRGAAARQVWLGQAELLELHLGGTGRVLMRPSGTEPKLKIYVDLRGEAPLHSSQMNAARAELEGLGKRVAQALCSFAFPADA